MVAFNYKCISVMDSFIKVEIVLNACVDQKFESDLRRVSRLKYDGLKQFFLR